MCRSLTVVSLLIVVLLATVTGNCFGKNLVVNGGFEEIGTDSVPPGWQINISRNTKTEIGFDESIRRSGRYSYKIDIAPPGGQVTFYSTDEIFKRPVPGRSYKLSLWINTRNLDYNDFFVAPAVRLNFRPVRLRPNPTIDLMSTMEGVTGWKELSLTVEAPKGAEHFYLDLLLTNGTVWIDDIKIEPL